jgi:nicotinate phosphoribosyltransferase
VLKLSEGKETWVGSKALYRSFRGDGTMAGDVLALDREPPPSGYTESLLQPVVRAGELMQPLPSLADIRRRCAEQLTSLPNDLKRLGEQGEFPVAVSPGLRARQERALAEVGARRPG